MLLVEVAGPLLHVEQNLSLPTCCKIKPLDDILILVDTVLLTFPRNAD